MLKWLLVLGVIWVVYYYFIKAKPVTKHSNQKSKKEYDAQEMVECAKCGVYVELDEAILSNGKYYCSQECIKG